MRKPLKFVVPGTGEEIVAEWTTATDFAIHKLTPGLCGKKHHCYDYILCLTQWGLDRQHDTVVARCKRCGKTKAYKVFTIYEPHDDDGNDESELGTAPAV